MKLFLTGTLAMVFTGVWGWQYTKTATLRNEVEQQSVRAREVATLERERDRLRGNRVAAVEASRGEPRNPEAARRAVASVATRESESTAPSSLASGAWLASEAWRNRGNMSAAAAIETLLWAAAGGDLAMLQKILLLDDATRQAGATLFARQPTLAQRFGGPEQLVAAFTTKSIPLGKARLDLEQSGSDKVNAYLTLKSREDAAATAMAKTTDSASDRTPPSLPEDTATKLRILTVRRDLDGWRVIVPPSAIDRIAQEITDTKIP